MVINKPAGLLTQAPRGIDSLEVRVKDFYRTREGKDPDAKVYLGLAHRIDRPVTGAIVFARHERAARKLCSQFAERTVKKTYWAFVEGLVAPEQGTWTDYLQKCPGKAHAEVVDADHPAAKHAVLHYRVLWHSPLGSWLEVELETGRTHQIRVQAASRGYAVLGDSQYGSTMPFGLQQKDLRARTIALHARQLGFLHPMTGAVVDVTAPLPCSWKPLKLPAENENEPAENGNE